jgi:WD40 repeat protein
MPRVTVSFAASDTEWAEHVARWAADKGYDVERLPDDASARDPEELNLHLMRSDALLAVMTPSWMASPTCRSVFRAAQLLRRPVFPLMVSRSGELIIGSSLSRQTLSESEAAGLNWLGAAIESSTSHVREDRPDFRFCAFISYSHKDKTEARWLHRAIETFRMPKALVGRTTAFTRIGRTLGKAFRDDEELKGAADLGALIEGALDESRTLVVICSPRSAQSPYVNKEIESFKRLGREARIVPIIIDGLPHDARDECFPPALTRKAGADGLLTEEAAEPIGVDVRAHGRRRTLLKVVAGITGVDFDELERRDQRRRAVRARIMAASATVTLSLLIATAAIVQHDRERQAIVARAAEVLPGGRPRLAAQLALAGLPPERSVTSAGADAASTLKATGYAFATTPLEPQSRFAEAILTEDGSRLITRSQDNLVQIWNVGTRALVADLDFTHYGGPTTFESLDLSPDETRLLTMGSGPPQLWDAVTGAWIGELEGGHAVVGVTFSADGHWIAVPHQDEPTALFDASTARQVATFEASRYVHVSADGARIITAPERKAAVLWEGHSGRRLADSGRRLADLGVTVGYGAVSLSPDGARAVVQGDGSSVRLWDSASGVPLATLGGKDDAYRFEMSSDGQRVATLSLGGQAVLWDSADGRRIGGIGPEGSSSVRFSPAGDVVVTSSTRQAPLVWDARSGRLIGEIGTAEEGAGGLTFIPNRQRVALLTRGIGLVLRDSRSGALVARLADDNTAYNPQISKDGRIIQAKDFNHWVKLWDADTGAFIGALAGPREGHTWAIDGRSVHAVILSIDGTLRLSRIDAGLDAAPAALKERVCRENRDVIGQFPTDERDADTPAGLALRGYPWHACDWRGMKSFEGWAQLVRHWGTRAGLNWDYAPDTSAAPVERQAGG